MPEGQSSNPDGPRGYWFLRFAILPAVILLVMAVYVWDAHVSDIGCIGDHPARVLVNDPTIGARCETIAPAPPRPGAAKAARQPVAAGPPRVAVMQGRFQWMTFHLISLVLLPAAAALSLWVMYRNLGLTRCCYVAAGAFVLGGGLVFRYLAGGEEGINLLLEPTVNFALNRFDAEFASWARHGMACASTSPS